MSFDKIAGQIPIISELSNILSSGKMPQGIMLTERDVYGALPLALATAKSLLCQKPKDGIACGICQSCKLVAKGKHPDLHYSYPVVKHGSHKRADTFSDHFIDDWRTILGKQAGYMSAQDWYSEMGDAKGNANINVKECNEIIRKLTLQSYVGGAKVLILWLPEYLKKEGNRLLKIIEEPPKNSYLFFVTQEPGAILPTIISRFQVFRVPPLPDDDIASYLTQQYDIPPQRSLKIASSSNASLANALQQIDVQKTVDVALYLDWLRICYKSDPESIISYVNDFSKLAKNMQKQFLLYVLSMMRTSLKYLSTGQMDMPSLQDTELTQVKKLSGILSIQKISEISAVVHELVSQMDQNINIRISMLSDSLRIGQILRS